MISLNKDIENSIIHWDIVGDIVLSQVFNAIKETNSINPDAENLKVLQIDKDSVSKISISDHIKISVFARNHMKQYSKVRIAFVANKPLNVALVILAMKTLSGGKLIAKVFSEKENAKEWLLNKN